MTPPGRDPDEPVLWVDLTADEVHALIRAWSEVTPKLPNGLLPRGRTMTPQPPDLDAFLNRVVSDVVNGQ